MVRLTFIPESKPFIESARAYEAIWAAEGSRIVRAIEAFAERHAVCAEIRRES